MILKQPLHFDGTLVAESKPVYALVDGPKRDTDLRVDGSRFAEGGRIEVHSGCQPQPERRSARVHYEMAR
jgi:hypothetical protein